MASWAQVVRSRCKLTALVCARPQQRPGLQAARCCFAAQAGGQGGKAHQPSDLEKELERRYRDRLAMPATRTERRERGGGEEAVEPDPPPPVREPAMVERPPAGRSSSTTQWEEVERGALQMQLFAYPSSRRFPWATLSLLAASGCLTLSAALDWQLRVCQAQSVEELQPELETFTRGVSTCSVSSDDLRRGEVHRLLLTSMLRAGEQPARLLADVGVLLCCGTLLERLYGSSFVLTLVLAASALSNALGLAAHTRFGRSEGHTGDPRLVSTSGGVTALGAFCALRHGRWSAVPGLPLPVAWLMAPILAAACSAASTYWMQVAALAADSSRPGEEGEAAAAAATAAAAVDDSAPPSEESEALTAHGGAPLPASTFGALVALSACDAIEALAKSECRPPPEDIASWREEVGRAVETSPPMPPDGAFWADVFGACIAAALCLVAPRVL